MQAVIVFVLFCLGTARGLLGLLGLFVWAGPGGLRDRYFVLAATGSACTLIDVLRFLSSQCGRDCAAPV